MSSAQDAAPRGLAHPLERFEFARCALLSHYGRNAEFLEALRHAVVQFGAIPAPRCGVPSLTPSRHCRRLPPHVGNRLADGRAAHSPPRSQRSRTWPRSGASRTTGDSAQAGVRRRCTTLWSRRSRSPVPSAVPRASRSCRGRTSSRTGTDPIHQGPGPRSVRCWSDKMRRAVGSTRLSGVRTGHRCTSTRVSTTGATRSPWSARQAAGTGSLLRSTRSLIRSADGSSRPSSPRATFRAGTRAFFAGSPPSAAGHSGPTSPSAPPGRSTGEILQLIGKHGVYTQSVDRAITRTLRLLRLPPRHVARRTT